MIIDKKEFDERFRNKLKEKMAEKGIDDVTLASRSGLRTDVIRNYLAGHYSPMLDSAVKIADGLGCELSELLPKMTK